MVSCNTCSFPCLDTPTSKTKVAGTELLDEEDNHHRNNDYSANEIFGESIGAEPTVTDFPSPGRVAYGLTPMVMRNAGTFSESASASESSEEEDDDNDDDDGIGEGGTGGVTEAIEGVHPGLATYESQRVATVGTTDGGGRTGRAEYARMLKQMQQVRACVVYVPVGFSYF